jgi:predicted transcriptional regulator
MVTITMKLPESLATRLEQEAARRKTTKSALVRHCLEHMLVGTQSGESRSFHDLAQDKRARFRGPGDLATNPKHMQGFGE